MNQPFDPFQENQRALAKIRNAKTVDALADAAAHCDRLLAFLYSKRWAAFQYSEAIRNQLARIDSGRV